MSRHWLQSGLDYVTRFGKICSKSEQKYAPYMHPRIADHALPKLKFWRFYLLWSSPSKQSFVLTASRPRIQKSKFSRPDLKAHPLSTASEEHLSACSITLQTAGNNNYSYCLSWESPCETGRRQRARHPCRAGCLPRGSFANSPAQLGGVRPAAVLAVDAPGVEEAVDVRGHVGPADLGQQRLTRHLVILVVPAILVPAFACV